MDVGICLFKLCNYVHGAFIAFGNILTPVVNVDGDLLAIQGALVAGGVLLAGIGGVGSEIGAASAAGQRQSRGSKKCSQLFH